CRTVSVPSLIGALLCIWMYAFKVADFEALDYRTDLYSFVQHGTSWLHGHFLWDNAWGNHLRLHTYLLNPLLAVGAIPFGAYGLMAALAAAYGLTFFFAYQLCVAHKLPTATTLAIAFTLMPLTVNVFRDAFYGFHPEIFLVPLGLKLALNLTERRLWGSLGVGTLTCLLKEDAPILVGAIGAAAWITAALRREWRIESALVVLLAALALPVLVSVVSADAYTRLTVAAGASEERDLLGLLQFVLDHLRDWVLRGQTINYWIAFSLGSFFAGFASMLALTGFPISVTAWLMPKNLFWSPRFAPIIAIAIIAAITGLHTLWHRTRYPKLLLGAAMSVAMILQLWVWGGWLATDFYLVTRWKTLAAPRFDHREVDIADAIFAEYRRLKDHGEPVTATPTLFRYAHDRNLIWPDKLQGRPRPKYILYDAKEGPRFAFDFSGYEQVAASGPFSFWRDTREQ